MTVESALYDPEPLEVMAGELDHETMMMLVQVYLDDMDEQLSILKSSMESGDMNMLEIKSHALKSTSYSFGGMRLGDISKEVEFATKEGRHDDLPEMLTRLYVIAEETKPFYIEMLAS